MKYALFGVLLVVVVFAVYPSHAASMKHMNEDSEDPNKDRGSNSADGDDAERGLVAYLMSKAYAKKASRHAHTKYGGKEALDIAAVTCDMESDGSSASGCRLRQDTTDDFNWLQNSGLTPSGEGGDREIEGVKYPVTGPAKAKEGTFYLYTEASGSKDGQAGRLILVSDDVKSGKSCLQFSYSMNGFHVGKLSVYTKASSGAAAEEAWKMEGDQLQDWKSASVQLDSPAEVGFEGTVKGEFSGDIALDDVKVTKGSCPGRSASSKYRSKTYTQGETVQKDCGTWTVHAGESLIGDESIDYGYYQGADSCMKACASGVVKPCFGITVQTSLNGDVDKCTFHKHPGDPQKMQESAYWFTFYELKQSDASCAKSAEDIAFAKMVRKDMERREMLRALLDLE